MSERSEANAHSYERMQESEAKGLWLELSLYSLLLQTHRAAERNLFCASFIQNYPVQQQTTHTLSYKTKNRVGKQIVDIPSFIVRLDSQKHIDFALTSPYGGGRAGRCKRKRAAAAAAKGTEEEAEDDE